jgi:heptosyltransferase-1
MPEPGFLVVRLGSLGDIVHTFPAVSGLRETFPGERIVWLTHPRWKFLVETSSLASEVWTVDSRDMASVKEALSRIRKTPFGTSIDYQGLWKSAALPFLARIERRIGFSSQTIREYGVPVLYTDRVHVHSAHVADQNGELSLHAGARAGVAPIRLRIESRDEERIAGILQEQGIKDYVVLSPGGGWRSKCWPAERYGALAEMLYCKKDVRSVINFAPGEEDLVSAAVAGSGHAKALPFCGTLGELMAVLKGAGCVVAGDTGPLHLADALGAPAVALFGPTDPARNGLYFKSGVELRAPGVHSTYKRHDQPHPSLLHLSVQEVFEAVQRVQVRR